MHRIIETRTMASLFKKILRVYEDLQSFERARTTAERDLARMHKELARRESRAERGWRVNP